LNALRATLDPWLGRPQRSSSRGNVTLVYRFTAEIAPVRPLRLKIETNTREHFTVLGRHKARFAVSSPWFVGSAEVTTYSLNELLGTKVRALYQRKKGRDLFDLWLCIARGMIDLDEVAKCFTRYMEFEGKAVSRAEFEENLYEKAGDPAFLDDVKPLLATGIEYDHQAALSAIQMALLPRLPGEPWKGRRPQ
jgi:hypothetical protein